MKTLTDLNLNETQVIRESQSVTFTTQSQEA